jgi:hypothetical protein
MVAPEFDPDGTAGLTQRLRRLGLDPSLSPAPQLRSSDLTWLVLASLPLVGFLNTLGNKLAEDGYEGLRDLVRHIARHGRTTGGNPRALLLEDQDTGTLIELGGELPEEGYRKLLELDLSSNVGVTLHYDIRTSQWTAAAEHLRGEQDKGDRRRPGRRTGVRPHAPKTASQDRRVRRDRPPE